MDEIVELYGADYVYWPDRPNMTSCKYVRDGQPDCLIAKVLFKLGVSVEKIATLDGGCGSIGNLLDRNFRLAIYNLEYPSTVRVLATAQTTQDNRGTWGSARDAAYKLARAKEWI